MNDPCRRPLPVVLLLSLAAAPTLAATCESMSQLALAGTTIVSAQAIPAGPFTLPEGPPIADMAALCPGSGALKALAVSAGYVAATTDTGHRGQATDASWALGHPEKVIDFGYRAIHEMTVAGKAVAAAFYGRPVQRAYFHGCSNGGRQPLMEALRFPADYDGILAGAPANYWTHLLAQGVWEMQATEGGPASYIPASKLPAIEAATLARCDAA